MCRYFFYIAIIFLLNSTAIFAQENRNSFSLFGSYTLSSKLYPRYGESDPERRNQFFTISDIFGIGADIRREFHDLGLQVGISIEYIETQRNFKYESISPPILTSDGYRVIPIEITGYFFIPISLRNWKFSLGTGFGLYWGNREYSVASVEPKHIKREIGAGIHVVSGIEYLFSEKFGLRAEVKFREIQFLSTERFGEKEFVYNENLLAITQGNIKSRILIDGMIFSAGIVYHP